ncbi:MAG: hypothetical protein BGO29_05875 [Bacteroidales bacterium 36-12]|nr:MAG: hypothetical protein BGO29_05875 [Bacteroidales bacterium 36-12]
MKTKKQFFNLLFIAGTILFILIACDELINPNSDQNQDQNPNPDSDVNYLYGETIEDADGNKYKTVRIGNQVWMAENLKTTKYNDGTDIPLVEDRFEWMELIYYYRQTGAYCNPGDVYTYGRLYNGYAVKTGQLCPEGWHVPTEIEWKRLVDYLGGPEAAAVKLKETGTEHWNHPNVATNEYGFTALPGGERLGGEFYKNGFNGSWWSNTLTISIYGLERWLRSIGGERVSYYHEQESSGRSIRCLKDTIVIDSVGSSTITYNGYKYKTVYFLGKEWFAENLRTTKYSDGTEIPLVTNQDYWTNRTTHAYCWYENDQSTYGNIYGALYNWYAVETDKLCPKGWHVSTHVDWDDLTHYLEDGYQIAGGILKETGTEHWKSPNKGATNEYGFTAFPGGCRNPIDGTFNNIGYGGYWWSATESTATSASGSNVYYDSSSVNRGGYHKEYGFSVRCVRDNVRTDDD